MCGTALAGDIPGEDQENFRKFVIEINLDMTDEEIIDKLVYYLRDSDARNELIQSGLKWSEDHTQEKYAERFVQMLESL